MDDVETGNSTHEEALELYKDSKMILKDGAFNLRKFRMYSGSLQTEMDAAKNHLIVKQDTYNPSLEETYVVDAKLGRPHGLGSPGVKVL